MGQRRPTKQFLIELLIIALLIIFAALNCDAAITRTQQVTAAANSATLTTATSNGDLILVFAYSTTSTAPTLVSGYTQIDSLTSGSESYTVAYKVSTGGETTTGTWTNAVGVSCMVYTGAQIPGTGESETTGSSTVLTYPAVTMQVTDGTSWIIGFGGVKTATSGMNSSTTNLTNRTNSTKLNGLDSGGGKTSFAAETITVTPTGPWLGFTMELRLSTAPTPTPTPTATPNKAGNFLQFFP
jgi:hypothetical protein